MVLFVNGTLKSKCVEHAFKKLQPAKQTVVTVIVIYRDNLLAIIIGCKFSSITISTQFHRFLIYRTTISLSYYLALSPVNYCDNPCVVPYKLTNFKRQGNSG